MQYEYGKCCWYYFCSSSDCNLNRSDEEGEDCFGNVSLHMDRLSMKLSKWQFKRCPHLTLFCCKATMVAAKMTKNIGKGVGEKDGKDSDEDGEKDEGDFDDSHPGPTFRSGICEC